tara:strand:+ start:1 stop:1275 length:1275 start_codon:yes stop_codon:yes gene_type:complete
MDTSKLWDRDLDMYNSQWNDYRNFIGENHAALQNPSKNPKVWMAKKKMEQEMLQFVSSSSAAAKQNVEAQKLKLTNKRIRDKDGLYAKWQGEAGNFSNPFEMLSQQVDPMSQFITDFASKVPKDTSVIYENTEGVKSSKQGTTKEGWSTSYGSYYDNTPELQESADEAWIAAGGSEESGFDNAKDYFLSEADKSRPVIETSLTRKQDSGISFGFGGVPSTLNWSSDVIKTKTVINNEVVEDNKRQVIFTQKGGQEMPTMHVNLQGKVTNEDGEDVTDKYKDGLPGAKVESIVEISEGKYEVQYSVPRRERDFTAEKNALQAKKMMWAKRPSWGTNKEGLNKTQWDERRLEHEKLETALAAEEKEGAGKGKGFDIIRVPIDNITNIADLESNLKYEQGTLIPNLPDLMTKQAKGGKDSDPAGLFQ